MSEEEYKLAIERSRRLLAQRFIGMSAHGCDGCLSLPICKRLRLDEPVMCELDDEEAGVDPTRQSSAARGNKLTWAA